jgi:hypothetical protein
MDIKKFVVVINLLIWGIVFTILSFKRENLFMFYQYIFVSCRKIGRIIRDIFGKVIINAVENSNTVL